MSFTEYRDFRGEKAAGMSSALGIPDPGQRGFLVEFRSGRGVTDICAHSDEYMRGIKTSPGRFEIRTLDIPLGQMVTIAFNTDRKTVAMYRQQWDPTKGLTGPTEEVLIPEGSHGGLKRKATEMAEAVRSHIQQLRL